MQIIKKKAFSAFLIDCYVVRNIAYKIKPFRVVLPQQNLSGYKIVNHIYATFKAFNIFIIDSFNTLIAFQDKFVANI